MTSNLYGKTKTEKEADEMKQDRQIVQTIMDFGVKQNQLLHIIKLLSFELENMDYTRMIDAVVRSIQEDSLDKSDQSLFHPSSFEEEEEAE